MAGRIQAGAVILFWLAAMGWLVAHDVVPAWTAQQAPRFVAGDWLTDDLLRAQARIENKYGQRIGTVWTTHTRDGAGLSRQDILWLDKFPLLPPIRIQGDSDFTREGELDTFVLKVFGHSEPIELRGERYSGQFAFRLDVGTRIQIFKIDASLAGLVADAFRPFPTLPALEVGQSWRMQVVNPLAVITGVGARLLPMLVRVTGRADQVVDGRTVSCFVVESSGARAWVDDRGVVLRQEMELPLGGTLAIIAEPFDEAQLRLAQDVDLAPPAE